MYGERYFDKIKNSEFFHHIKLNKNQFKKKINWIMNRIADKGYSMQKIKLYVKQLKKEVLVDTSRASVWQYLIILSNACVTGCNWRRMSYYFGVEEYAVVNRA